MRSFTKGDDTWAIETVERKQTVHLGPRGGKTKTQMNVFSSVESAIADMAEKIDQKLRDGWVEQSLQAPPAEEAAVAFDSLTVDAARDEGLLDDEQIERFGLSADDEVLVHRGDLTSDADLCFDNGDVAWVVDGAVRTSGSVQNSDPLVVRGDVFARDFETYGWCDVEGSIVLQTFLYGDSRCNQVLNAGPVRAAIDAGHTFAASLDGCVTVALMVHGGGIDEPTAGADTVAAVVVDEVIVDGELDLDRLRERSAAGLPLLRR